MPFVACGGGDDTADGHDGDPSNGSPSGASSSSSSGGASSSSSSGASSSGDPGMPPGPANTTFRGPINMGADPFMAYHDGFYYLSTTQGDALRMWKARSVGDLLMSPPTTIWKDTDPSRNREIWAPAFYFIDGHWYVYYTADDGVDDHHRMYVVESDAADALGPYHFKARLDVPGADYWAIDAELLQQNGKLYMTWSGAGPQGHNLIYIAPMSNPWTISGPRTYLAASGGCPEVREGPSILQHDDKTFMIYSACDTGKPDYQLWMKSIPKAADPLVAGNWTQHAGAVLSRNDAAGIFGPGHNGFFKSPDGREDWIVYHAKNTATYTYDGRTTRIDRVTWGADGMPSIGAPPATGATRTVPSGDPGGGPEVINDTDARVTYTGAWTAYPKCGVTCFEGNDHGATEAGATATIAFTGTQIALLSVRDAGNGIAAVALDGKDEARVDFYMSPRQGEQLVYVSPHVAYGPHTLTVRVLGEKNGASSGTAVSIDRAEIATH